MNILDPSDVASVVELIINLPIPPTFFIDVTFEKFTLLIRQKEIVMAYNNFLNQLAHLQTKYNMINHKLPNAREFLCLYVIKGYSADVLNNPPQEHDLLLLECVNHIFELMYSYNIHEFIEELMIYQELFNQWKTMDKVTLLEQLNNSLAKLEESKLLCQNDPEESRQRTLDSINAIIQKIQTMINKIS
jgi:hypothetical protein